MQSVSVKMSSTQEMNDSTEKQKEEKSLKIILTTLIFISLMGLDIFWSLPGATLILEDLQEGELLLGEYRMKNMLFVFNFRALGYAAGISIGLMFDMVSKQKYRILIILGLVSLELMTCMAIPTSTTLNAIAASFYSSGLSMSALDIVLCIYILDIWKESSHPVFQSLQFFGSLGKLFGPLLARSFLPLKADIETGVHQNTNGTAASSPEWNRAQHYPSVMFSYAALSVVLTVILVMWLCMFAHSNGRVVYKQREQAEPPSEGFTVFALVSTFLLFFITGTVDYGYQHVLPSLAYTLYGMPPAQALDLLAAFWAAYAVGALVAVFCSLVLHPFAMLLSQVLVGVGASLALAHAQEAPGLFLGNALLGLGLSNQRATTLLWLESFLRLNHKMLAVLFVGKLSAEMIIPVALSRLSKRYGHRGIYLFLLSVPIAFSFVLLTQLVVFMKHRKDEWKTPIFVSRRRMKIKRHSA